MQKRPLYIPTEADICKLQEIRKANDINRVLPEDDLGVSPEVTEDFMFEMPVNHSHKRGKNDSTLTMVAFVFDLNFDYSYEYFRKHKFMDKMYKKLNNKELFKPYIDEANNYVERKCKDAKDKIFS